MANSLLDFVMSIVRDPDAAAAYADNPDQAILDANLTDVTSADVSNLIPVVSESMSSAVPTTGAESLIGDMAGNVWASGAATAAFDAFDAPVPVQGLDDAPTAITESADEPNTLLDSGFDALADSPVPGLIESDDAAQAAIDDLRPVDLPADSDLADVIEVADLDSDPSGFDIF